MGATMCPCCSPVFRFCCSFQSSAKAYNISSRSQKWPAIATEAEKRKTPLTAGNEATHYVVHRGLVDLDRVRTPHRSAKENGQDC